MSGLNIYLKLQTSDSGDNYRICVAPGRDQIWMEKDVWRSVKEREVAQQPVVYCFAPLFEVCNFKQIFSIGLMPAYFSPRCLAIESDHINLCQDLISI